MILDPLPESERSLLKKLLAAKECWKDERQQQWGRKRRTSSRDNCSLVRMVNEDCSSSHNRNHVKVDPGHGRNCLSHNQRQRQRCLTGVEGKREIKVPDSRGRVEDSQNPSCWSSSPIFPLSDGIGRRVKCWIRSKVSRVSTRRC